MSVKSILSYSSIFLALSVFAFTLVFHSMTDRDVRSVIRLPKKTVSEQVALTAGRCSDREKITDLESASDPHLLKLSEYQAVCDSFVTDRIMLFTDMPKDKNGAVESAKKMAETLKEFSRFHVTPIVVVEPVNEWGLIDFKEFGTGFYDKWITAYFKAIKAEGVTDDMMGIWVPFPEANLPYWNHENATPKDFSVIVNKYLGTLKKEFPQAKGSVLLNSATYDNEDFNWESGEYVSLVPYVSGIKKGLVDSFGIQGFPWAPPAGSERVGLFDAREYLNARLAMEAADTLEVKDIWFNTGSFSSKYTLDEKMTIAVDPGKRKDVLNGILSEVISAQKKGYSVWLNIFAENKSQLAEATDWSYWSDTDQASDLNRSVFVDFMVKAKDIDIPVSLFDVRHQ
ncbi:MAG: hypothetical protein PHT88_01775 [Candidatus Moranbacteria bacterium]|nr:hypothetical protein [Candidatus Moranbacteria bacterium]